MYSVEWAPLGSLLLQRIANLLVGGMTVVLLPYYLSPPEQGYYFTYASLLAAQIAFDCGLSFVVLQLIGHFIGDAGRTDAMGEVARQRLTEIRLLLWLWSRRAAFPILFGNVRPEPGGGR